MAASPRIGIVVVAYNAATTLAWVLDRIPADFRPRISAILVSDDHSHDDTELVGLEYQEREAGLPLTVVRQPRNLGYGGNQKFGYRWAIEHGLDIVVLLHGDGQYAPELLADIVDADRRAATPRWCSARGCCSGGHARDGGMPLYKYVGNRVLTRVQNAVAGLALSEWHSGYRALSVAALATIPFEANSDGFDFDTEILLQLHANGLRIAEVPIPTYYGDEICYVNGLAYARDVTSDVVRYRLARIGFGTPLPGTEAPEYEWKPDRGSSHAQLLELVGARPPGRVLDLGCGSGRLGAALRERGHHVVGVDVRDSPEAKERLDHVRRRRPRARHPRQPSTSTARTTRSSPPTSSSTSVIPARLLVELRDLARAGRRARRQRAEHRALVPAARGSSAAASTTTPAASSTATTCGSSPGAASAASSSAAGWRIAGHAATGPALRRRRARRPRRRRRPAAGRRRLASTGAGVRAWPTLFAYQFVVTLEPR